MPTREEFVAKYRAEIEGWILDAALEGRRGSELAVWLRNIRYNIGTRLGVMYDDIGVVSEPPNLKLNRGPG